MIPAHRPPRPGTPQRPPAPSGPVSGPRGRTPASSSTTTTTPPPARGICPLAWARPGRRDASYDARRKQPDPFLLLLLLLCLRPERTGPSLGGGGRVRDPSGRERESGRSAEVRPGHAPSSGRAGVSTPRRVGAGSGRAGARARARASGDFPLSLRPPSLVFLKFLPELQRRLHAASVRMRTAPVPPFNYRHFPFGGGRGWSVSFVNLQDWGSGEAE